jgi:hypothetical protein
MGLLEDDSQTVKTHHPFCLTLWLIFMNRLPIPKKMQIHLTGFLTDSTPVFMAALWNLQIEVQTSPAGIPQSFVEEKKVETRRAKQGDTRALTERDRKQKLDEIRELERSEKSDRGGGRRNWKRRSTERQWLEQPWRREQSFPRFQSKENISRPLASTISLSSSPPVAGRPPAIARLVPATLRIAPAPAAPSARVRIAHIYTAGLRPLVILLVTTTLAPLALFLTHETTSGTAGVEGMTAAAHRRAEDVSAPHCRRGGALPVEAPTTLIADAVQAHVAPEKAAHCPASGRRLLRVGNGASGIGVRTGAGAGAGVQRTGGALQTAV